MTAISELGGERQMREREGNYFLDVRGTVSGFTQLTFWPAGLVAVRDGSSLAEVPDPANPRADLRYVGCSVNEVLPSAYLCADNLTAATDSSGAFPLKAIARPGIAMGLDTGTGANAITADMVGRIAYGFDNNTVYATDNGGTLSPVGPIHSMNADGTVSVTIEPDFTGWSWLLASGAPAEAQKTQDDTVRFVATSMPAGSFSNGVFTATTPGAFSTAQDTNVTPALNDKFVLPAGTIGSLTVTAAQSGVYEMSNLGGTGVSMQFTHTARWPHNAVITPETAVKVGAEGALFGNSVWRAAPATSAKLVDADDPQLAPDRIIQSVTLASSTVDITNVPIRAAARTVAKANFVSANSGTLTGTVGYGPIVAPTIGGVGTGKVTIVAIASGQTKNGTADTSILTVEITQQ